MRIAGYARCSTRHQSLDDQVHRITGWADRAGHDLVEVFEDFATSGAKAKRPGLDALLAAAKDHRIDAIVITKLDRLFRSTKHLLETVDELARLGIDFVTLDQPIDTASPSGRMFLTMVAAFAEFERELARERVRDGLAAARRRGVKLGAPGLPRSQVHRICALLEAHTPIMEIQRAIGCSRTTIYKIKSDLEASDGIEPSGSP